MSEPININLPGPAAATPGPDHRAVVVPTAPSKAFWRTLVQAFIPAAISLLLILPVVLQDILDGFGRQLPESIYGILVSITAAVTLAAAIIARLMANPLVIEWTKKYVPFLAPQKQGTEAP